LVAAIPFAAYWTLWLLRVRGMATAALVAVLLGSIFVITIGIGVTRSRAGVILGACAIIGSMAMIARNRNTPGAKPLLLSFGGAIVAGAAMVGLFSLNGLLERFQSADEPGNSRSAVFATIAKAGGSVWPAGAGFGSFVPVYAMFEPANSVSGFFLNHAHNDYLELWLEGGLLAVLIAIVGLAWVGWATMSAWSTRTPGDRDLSRAASIAVLMLLIHSTVDYPLRTAALAAIFGVTCGMMVPMRQTVKA